MFILDLERGERRGDVDGMHACTVTAKAPPLVVLLFICKSMGVNNIGTFVRCVQWATCIIRSLFTRPHT